MRRSRFTSFSESLGATLAPLLSPLREADRLVEDLDAGAIGRLSWSLRSVREDLEETLAGVAERRPHVLVTGPPKSGKSTLLVALARSYVTKVTDLPSLSVPVRVVHAPSWSLTLVRNDGTRETFGDPTSARVEVQRAHRALVDATRAAELDGVDFDPRRQAPRAACRVELQVPARSLRESRIALVELPSPPLLEPRARLDALEPFDAEASATVLVVRTEDLSRPDLLRTYEPMFTEDRSVFLVLNLDPRKVDLGNEGERLTAHDLEDPVGVIEAFQALAATPAWLEAFDNGRVRVHLVPLFDIASARLAAASGRVRAQRQPIGPQRAPAQGRAETDGLTALEQELDDSLHDGVRWRQHVEETLRGVDSLLADLKHAFDEAEHGRPDRPASLEPGVRALERALDAVGHMRRRHLS